MRSIANSIFGKSLAMVLGATFLATTVLGGTTDSKETSDKMNVDIVSAAAGKSKFNLNVNKGNTANDVFVTIYDNNNTKVFAEKLKTGKSLKKKYRLSKFNSKSYYFVVESGNKVHTQEVM